LPFADCRLFSRRDSAPAAIDIARFLELHHLWFRRRGLVREHRRK
jgi:hypothetical protein